MTKSIARSGRLAIMAGLLAIAAAQNVSQASAANMGHQSGMTGSMPGTVFVPSGRPPGHGYGGGAAPPYAYPGDHSRHIHQYDPNDMPDGPMVATGAKKGVKSRRN